MWQMQLHSIISILNSPLFLSVMHQEMESVVHFYKTANLSSSFPKLSQIHRSDSNIEREILAMVVVIENFIITYSAGISRFILTILLWLVYLKNV